MSNSEELLKDDTKFDTVTVEPIEKCAQIELSVNNSTDSIPAKRGKRVLRLATIFDNCNYPIGTRSGDKDHCYEYGVTMATWRVYLNNCSVSVSDIIGAHDLQNTTTETHTSGASQAKSGEGTLEAGASMKDGLSGSIGGKGASTTTTDNNIETAYTVPHYSLHPVLEDQLNLVIGTGDRLLSGKFNRNLAIVWEWTQTSTVKYQGKFNESDVEIISDSTTYVKRTFSNKPFATRKRLIRGLLDDLNRNFQCDSK